MVLHRSKPDIKRNLAAKFAGKGPPSAYQCEPLAANPLAPIMQKRVRSSLRSLSVHCQTLPHMSKQPKGDFPRGKALTGVVEPMLSVRMEACNGSRDKCRCFDKVTSVGMLHLINCFQCGLCLFIYQHLFSLASLQLICTSADAIVSPCFGFGP